MSNLATVSHIAAALPAVDDPGTGYTPAQFGTDLGGALVNVLPYVGVAVAAVLVIVFTLVGIRKGISWARSLTSKG